MAAVAAAAVIAWAATAGMSAMLAGRSGRAATATSRSDTLPPRYSTSLGRILATSHRMSQRRHSAQVFGSGAESAPEVKRLLEEERSRLTAMLRSCGWHTRCAHSRRARFASPTSLLAASEARHLPTPRHTSPHLVTSRHTSAHTRHTSAHARHSRRTLPCARDIIPTSLRERAEAVVDVLDAAALSLRRANPEAIAATFGALREAAGGGMSEEATRELELAVQCRLAEQLEAGGR